MMHPDDATLQAWHDRELAGADEVSVREHLAQCAECEARIHALRALHGAMRQWAEGAPRTADLTASILSRIRDGERSQGPTASPPPPQARVLPLDGARGRRAPGRAVLYPALAAAAAFVLFLVWHKPSGVRFDALPPANSGPVVETVAGGVEVTQVDVQGAQSYSVLQVRGLSPGAMTAIVWIQDAPEESSPTSNAP